MTHPVMQWQILTTDPAKHSAFYQSVFGWDINVNNALGYRMTPAGSPKGIPGGFWPAPPEAQAFVQLFVEAPDISEVINKVTQHGGSVLIPPQTLPDGDKMAILRDPLGVTFGVVTSAAR